MKIYKEKTLSGDFDYGFSLPGIGDYSGFKSYEEAADYLRQLGYKPSEVVEV